MTIHKSQGLAFGQLTVDLGGGGFAEGQTNVALSRARSIAGIALAKPISMRDIRCDATAVDFYRQLGIAHLGIRARVMTDGRIRFTKAKNPVFRGLGCHQ